ncbi:MAG: type IV toxin-antitoxin system AbiEi family antitoxin domain-containing protein [Oligoflexus sp.]
MSRLNKALSHWSRGELHSLSWLSKYEISPRVANKYYARGSLKKVAPGIFARPYDQISWQGVVGVLQNDLKLPIHVGGRSALELHGVGHYIQIGDNPIINVISRDKARVPFWAKSGAWNGSLKVKQSSMITTAPELTKYERGGISIDISSREQAILEFIEEIDLSDTFETAQNYMEGLLTLRPQVVQHLLENCKSVKVKRVFLFLAKYLELPFYEQLKVKKIDLGSGKRLIAKDGNLDTKFNITVPKKYFEDSNGF